MTENLSEMVKDQEATDPVAFDPTDLDLPPEEEAATEETEVAPAANVIPIMPLSTWFEREADKFDNINQVKVAIRGVDEDKTLIMAVKTGEEAAEGDEDPRNLRVYENADVYPVLDLPATSMEV